MKNYYRVWYIVGIFLGDFWLNWTTGLDKFGRILDDCIWMKIDFQILFLLYFVAKCNWGENDVGFLNNSSEFRGQKEGNKMVFILSFLRIWFGFFIQLLLGFEYDGGRKVTQVRK